MALKQ